MGEKIIIIGAGIAGCLSALELSKHHKVILIECGPEVIPSSSTSYNECYKLHTGMHYLGDLETAKQCLTDAVYFARQFKSLIAGGDNLQAPWRRGRHYLMSNSFITPDVARAKAEQLKNHYQQLIKKDPNNEVFGPVEHFIEELNASDYAFLSKAIPVYDENGQVHREQVCLGFETGESQIDIDKLKNYLQQKIVNNPNIEFIPNSEVTAISPTIENFGYAVTVKTLDHAKKTYKAKGIVNCTWHNIEALDVIPPDSNGINRIKLSIKVALPDALKKLNTCIFSLGPYCSITVLPDGHAILTSERVTNVGSFAQGVEPSSEIKALLNGELELSTAKGRALAEQILNDCADYFIPEIADLFKQSIIKETHVGIVKMVDVQKSYDKSSIYTKDSSIHARRFDGVQHRSLCYVANAAMKMSYAAANAKKVSSLISHDLAIVDLIEAKDNNVAFFKNPSAKSDKVSQFTCKL